MLQRMPRKIAPKRSGESESNAEDYCTGQSSPKRSKQNEHGHDLSFAEISFNIDIIYQENKEKKKETLENLIKHIVALLNSAGGVIRINESGNDEKTIIKQRDIWMQGLEQILVDILTQNEYKQCIHYDNASKFPYYYLFVRKSKRVCTQSSGLKIPLERSVNDATYKDILNILDRKSVSVSQHESSSLEMSDEDMESDSGYTEDTPTSNFPDEEHDKFHFEKKVSFDESDTVQFKLIKNGRATMKDLLKGIDSHLPNYVSAFANCCGGKVYFGIHDDGTLKGQLVEGEDEKREVREMVEKVMKRKNENQEMVRIWGKPDFIPKYDEQWSVEFVEVIGKPEGEERCVVVVEIFPFNGGMFLERPLAWKVDESSEKIAEIDFVEWRNLHASGSEDQEIVKRFQCLTLASIGKRVYQLKDMTAKFAEKVFPAKRRLKLVPENFAERFKIEQEKDCIRHMEKILQRSYSDKKGFVMFDKSWSGNVGIGPAPAEVICDMFVMSHTGMPRMITLASEYSEKVKKYNLNLAKKLKFALVSKGGCLECFGVDAQVILLNDINDEMKFPPNVSYPAAYNMTLQLFTKIREALVVVLATFQSSSFNPTVGASFLYILTPEQYDISIREEPFVVVSAPPGTGKTVVAMERIKRLQTRRVSKGEILYICENKSLASFVWSELRGICISITRAKFVLNIKHNGYDEFNCVRHVVVDEAQNFRNEIGENWFKSIFKILNWPNDSQQHYDNTSLYIFCDQLQKIRREYCGLSILDSNGECQMSDLFPTECRLSTVIRNSRKIYEEWEKIALKQSDFEKKNQLGIGHDYEGRDVNFVKLSSYDENQIFSTVKETIDQILRDKSYKASDVAVLFNTKGQAERFATSNVLAALNICVTDAEDFPRRGLVVDSFRRFSGLDAPVVIAVAPISYSDYENEDKVKIFLYSRAMVEFHIIA